MDFMTNVCVGGWFLLSYCAVNISYSEAQNGSLILKIALLVFAGSCISRWAYFRKQQDFFLSSGVYNGVKSQFVSQSVILVSTVSVSPGNLLETQISGPSKAYWIRNSASGAQQAMTL